MNPRYQCPVCEKYTSVDRSALSVGDRVTFTQMTQREYRHRITCQIKTVKGRIEQIQGEQVSVRYGKKLYSMNLNEINPAGAPSALFRAIVGTCTCGDNNEHR
ncbi:hypothetical protein ABLA30_04430 [Xenorhabdus nematophila]|uniref:hypothetical protein n=1 Tax=Xenorhabdus nematophila TaxID=628 RepID=UPI0032B8002E